VNIRTELFLFRQIIWLLLHLNLRFSFHYFVSRTRYINVRYVTKDLKFNHLQCPSELSYVDRELIRSNSDNELHMSRISYFRGIFCWNVWIMQNTASWSEFRELSRTNFLLGSWKKAEHTARSTQDCSTAIERLGERKELGLPLALATLRISPCPHWSFLTTSFRRKQCLPNDSEQELDSLKGTHWAIQKNDRILKLQRTHFHEFYRQFITLQTILKACLKVSYGQLWITYAEQ